MRIGWFAIGACAFGIAMAVFAPATWIDRRLGEASGGRLRLVESGGTVWSGAGRLEAREPDASRGVSRAIAWRFRPAGLLRARLAFDVDLEGAARPAIPVAIGVDGVELGDLDVTLPADLLGLAAPQLGPLRLGGELRVRIPSLTVGGGAIRGRATVLWLGAVSAHASVSPLGDYELTVEGRGSTVDARLGTVRGPLQLDGVLAWTPGRKPAAQATATVPSSHREPLVPLLRTIGVERGEGRYELRLP